MNPKLPEPAIYPNYYYNNAPKTLKYNPKHTHIYIYSKRPTPSRSIIGALQKLSYIANMLAGSVQSVVTDPVRNYRHVHVSVTLYNFLEA